MLGVASGSAGLFGREEELGTLVAYADAVVAGRGGAIVAVGDAGIGKSALLQQVCREAKNRGCTVLITTGVESETGMPFAALHQLLRQVLPEVSVLPDVQRDALLSAFGLREGQRPDPALIYIAVVNLLTILGRRGPVVVVADDVQWFDPQSYETFALLARHAGEAWVAVFGALRTGHPGPLPADGIVRLTVAGVNEEAASAILREHSPRLGEADQRRVRADARGNPLALLELPATVGARVWPGRDGVPPSLTVRLERAFAGRLSELAAASRDVVLVAACASVDELGEIYAAASVLGGVPIGRDALEPAVTAGLVFSDGARVEFRHPLVRSGILQTEGVARRLAAHAAIAEVVDDAYRKVWHRAQSLTGRDDELADALEANVEVALGRGAVMSAIQGLERAAQLTSRPDRRGRRLLMAAEHAFGLGRQELVGHLTDAAARLQLSELDTARLEWLREIFNDGTPGDAPRVMQLCDIARRSAAADDVDLALNLLLGAALRCWWADTGPQARAAVVAAARELAPVPVDDPRYVAILAVAEPLLECRTVLVLLDRVRPERTDAGALRLYGMAAHAVGDEVRAADLLAVAETSLREEGRLGLLPHVLSITVQVCLEIGEWPRARAAADEGQLLAEQTGQPIWSTGTMACDARADGLRGEVDSALRLAMRAELAASPGRLNDLLAVVQLARGAACFSEGRYDDAFRELARLFDPADPAFHRRERFGGVMYLAEAASRAGRVAEARPILLELERVAATETPSPLLAVHLLYARAVLADDDQAEALFLVALGADLSRWPSIRARLELEYARWLLGQGRARVAQPSLRSAIVTLDAMGAPAGAAEARRLLDLARATAGDGDPLPTALLE